VPEKDEVLEAYAELRRGYAVEVIGLANGIFNTLACPWDVCSRGHPFRGSEIGHFGCRQGTLAGAVDGVSSKWVV